jgi:hypothetical protein
MAGGKETPRQRMIGILYLVLLGLIALDVPENLLDSFKTISDSLNASKTNVNTGINNSMAAFEKTKLIQEPERARIPYANAQKAAKPSAWRSATSNVPAVLPHHLYFPHPGAV